MERPISAHLSAHRIRNAVVVAVAAAIAAVSLSYPFGRDQSLFQYVGREWFLRGRMPYRDVIEHKTPLIYFVHGVLVSVFGTRMWPSRLLEIGIVFLVAKLATIAAAPRGQKPAAGAFAATLILLVTFHYGWFTFWDTGNCEIWVALFVVGALAALRGIEDPARAAFACGIAIGLAVVAKPPAAWFIPPVFVVAAARYEGLRARAHALLRFSAGAAIFPLIVCAYFGAKGDLWFMFDVVVRASGHVATRERTVDTLTDVLVSNRRTILWFAPHSYVAIAMVLGIAAAFLRGNRAFAARYGVVLMLIVAGYGAVAMQLRFFVYHYGMLAVPAALAFALLFEDVTAMTRWKQRAHAPVLFAAVALLFLAVGGDGPATFGRRASTALSYVRGTTSSAALDSSFDVPGYFANTESHQVADWLKSHSSPSDNIVVRGYEPQIYSLSNRFYDGRFFWTTFLTHPARAYRREEWLEGDRRDLAAHPPRYAVTFEQGPGEIDNAAWFEARGYARYGSFGPFALLGYSGRSTLPDRCASALGNETVTLREGFHDVEYAGTPTPLRWSGERGIIALRREGGGPTWLRLEGRTAYAGEQDVSMVDFVIDGAVVETRDARPGQISVVQPIAPGKSAEVVVEIVARPPKKVGTDPRMLGFLVTRVCWE